MLDDEIESTTLDLLKEDVVAGVIRSPIVISDDRKWGKYYVQDGTHRAVAAILTGCSVPLIKSAEVLKDDSDPNLALITEVAFNTSLSDDELYDVMDILRSLKLNDDVWLVSSVMSIGQSIQVFWDSLLPNLESEITDAVTNRLSSFEGFGVTTFIEDMENPSDSPTSSENNSQLGI